MNALEIRGLTRSFPGFTLGPLDLNLPGGCILGLVGQNGAGKSTTIRLILDSLRRDGGSIRVLGLDNQDAAFTQLKNDIGVVLDTANFPETLTLKHIAALMRGSYTRWDDVRFNELVQRFGLPENKKFRDFSRGMQQKLAIACALSHQARLLILDEATAGLDPLVRDEILDLFREFVADEEHSVLISSHISSDLEKICDYIACLHQGKLLFSAEKDALIEEHGIWQGSAEQLAELPEAAVVAVQQQTYGVTALVKRAEMPAGAQLERPRLDDVFLFVVKQQGKGACGK